MSVGDRTAETAAAWHLVSRASLYSRKEHVDIQHKRIADEVHDG